MQSSDLVKENYVFSVLTVALLSGIYSKITLELIMGRNMTQWSSTLEWMLFSGVNSFYLFPWHKQSYMKIMNRL